MTKLAKITQLGQGRRSGAAASVATVRQPAPQATHTQHPPGAPHASVARPQGVPVDVQVGVRMAQNGVFLVRGPQGQIITCTSALELGNAIRSLFQLPEEAFVSERTKSKERYNAPDGFGLGDQMIVEGASWLLNKAQQGSKSGMGSMAGLTKRMKGNASARKRRRQKK